MVWRAPTSAAPATTGSRASWGRAPWAPPPIRATSKLSAEAASGPAWATAVPTSKRRSTWPPKMAAGALQGTGFQHRASAPGDLLRRLEHHQHVARRRLLRQQRRRPHRPRRVHVVAAGVHPARRLGGEGGAGLLGDRQGVDVAPGPPPPERRGPGRRSGPPARSPPASSKDFGANRSSSVRSRAWVSRSSKASSGLRWRSWRRATSRSRSASETPGIFIPPPRPAASQLFAPGGDRRQPVAIDLHPAPGRSQGTAPSRRRSWSTPGSTTSRAQ